MVALVRSLPCSWSKWSLVNAWVFRERGKPDHWSKIKPPRAKTRTPLMRQPKNWTKKTYYSRTSYACILCFAFWRCIFLFLILFYSEHLRCTHVTAFSPTSLFLERYWCEFRISFKFHKPISRSCEYNLKMVFLTFKRDVIFSLFHILSMRLQAEWSFHFPENVL